MNGYKNDYDEKVLSRSREKACDMGRVYVDWSQYRTAPKTGNLWFAGLLVLASLIAYGLSFFM